MAQWNDTGVGTFTAGAALAQYRRVRNSGGSLAYAGASDTDALGVLMQEAFAAAQKVPVWLRWKQGTVPMVASEAVTQFASVYAAANGKVATSGSVLVGIAMQAASGDGSVFEVLPATTAVLGSIARSALTQDDLAVYNVDLTSLRVHDAMQTNLPGTAAADDMALITGTPGTDAPTLQGVDFGGTTTDEKGAFIFPLPPEYVDGETITVRIRAGMLTTVSDGTATVDLECWKQDNDGAVGSDICATAAQSINSLTVANKDFTITPTGLVAGDVLVMRVAFAGSDTGNAGVMIPEIQSIKVLLDIKG